LTSLYECRPADGLLVTIESEWEMTVTLARKPEESAFFAQAAGSADNPLDNLLLLYLVEMDG
jgi:hypothetical protein